jgi:hypothetical protein
VQGIKVQESACPEVIFGIERQNSGNLFSCDMSK